MDLYKETNTVGVLKRTVLLIIIIIISQFIAQKFRENSNKNVNKCNWN